MTDKEKHKRIHRHLHKRLDQLIADMLIHTKMFPSKTTVTELMEWSHKQTTNPTEK